MVDSYTRPYVNAEGSLVYLTDSQYTEASKHQRLRKLRPGEVISPAVEPMVSIAPSPFTQGEAADTAVGDPVRHPVPEMRERRD